MTQTVLGNQLARSTISNEVIVNLSREGKRRLDIEIKFGFGISFEEVKAIVQRRIDRTDVILKEPKPRFGVSTVDPDGYKVMINIWVPAHGYTDLKLGFQERLIQDLKDAQLKLPGM